MANNPQSFDVGYLETSVTKPQKENEGAKDTYVSYMVITKVCGSWHGMIAWENANEDGGSDGLQVVHETGDTGAAAVQ
jgi:hypothetical protein